MAELIAGAGSTQLPGQLDALRPLERARLLLALQEATEEEYPTELFDSLRTLDDCLYYMAVKRGRQ